MVSVMNDRQTLPFVLMQTWAMSGTLSKHTLGSVTNNTKARKR